MDTKPGNIPPIDSIADSSIIPDTDKLGFGPFNRIDEVLLSLDHPCTYVTTAISGGNRTHKYHNFVVKNTDGAPISMLYKDFNPRGAVRIALCGPNTDLFRNQVLKYHSPSTTNDKLYYQFLVEMNIDYVGQPDLSDRFNDTELANGN